MQTIHQSFRTSFQYDVLFTDDLFDPNSDVLSGVLETGDDPFPRQALVVVDRGVSDHHPDLLERVESYFSRRRSLELAAEPVIVPGGEAAKNNPQLVTQLHQAIFDAGLCRHSFVIVIGGGSAIDLAGYAAATAHRGIRLVRVPTTVLGQNDSAVGVKNGVNRFGVKNFLGTFAPPFAVINDFAFLETLEDRDWRSGISEAVKVALLKDAPFFEELEQNAELLAPPGRDRKPMERLIRRCAELHLEHIATSGDPFEMGTSRPLDFGHWAAHQLEQLTNFDLRHGEAVAIGISLDATYSCLNGMLDESKWDRILSFFQRVGFDLYVPELDDHADDLDHPRCIFRGLEAFREHLGGELTIMLLKDIGSGVEVHSVDRGLYRKAISVLRNRKSLDGISNRHARNVA